jgi:acetoacetyl-CoA reductase
MVSLVIEKFGGIDVLINAAGISLNGFAHKASPSDWRATIDVNLVGAFNVIRSFLPFLREQRFGRIINISSVVFQHPVLGTSAYSASKAGLVGLTRTIALENASFGITCNCIALGYMDAGLTGSISPTVMEEIVRRIPLGRLGTIGELRRTIDYLVETEYITGQTVSLNGGLIMV